MATVEVFDTLQAVRDAELCVQRCQQDLDVARRRRTSALERQEKIRNELAQVERSLNISEKGQTALGGPRQANFPTAGGKAALLARRKELRALLMARPDQVAPPRAMPTAGRLF